MGLRELETFDPADREELLRRDQILVGDTGDDTLTGSLIIAVFQHLSKKYWEQYNFRKLYSTPDGNQSLKRLTQLIFSNQESKRKALILSLIQIDLSEDDEESQIQAIQDSFEKHCGSDVGVYLNRIVRNVNVYCPLVFERECFEYPESHIRALADLFLEFETARKFSMQFLDRFDHNEDFITVVNEAQILEKKLTEVETFHSLLQIFSNENDQQQFFILKKMKEISDQLGPSITEQYMYLVKSDFVRNLEECLREVLSKGAEQLHWKAKEWDELSKLKDDKLRENILKIREYVAEFNRAVVTKSKRKQQELAEEIELMKAKFAWDQIKSELSNTSSCEKIDVDDLTCGSHHFIYIFDQLKARGHVHEIMKDFRSNLLFSNLEVHFKPKLVNLLKQVFLPTFIPSADLQSVYIEGNFLFLSDCITKIRQHLERDKIQKERGITEFVEAEELRIRTLEWKMETNYNLRNDNRHKLRIDIETFIQDSKDRLKLSEKQKKEELKHLKLFVNISIKASRLIFLDEHVTRDVGGGRNLEIYSDQIAFLPDSKKIAIDLSGRHGELLDESHTTALPVSHCQDGPPGEDGRDGESSGSLRLVSVKIIKDLPQKLLVICNGGVGSNGQDGSDAGHGVDGKRGRCGKDKLPKVCDPSGDRWIPERGEPSTDKGQAGGRGGEPGQGGRGGSKGDIVIISGDKELDSAYYKPRDGDGGIGGRRGRDGDHGAPGIHGHDDAWYCEGAWWFYKFQRASDREEWKGEFDDPKKSVRLNRKDVSRWWRGNGYCPEVTIRNNTKIINDDAVTPIARSNKIRRTDKVPKKLCIALQHNQKLNHEVKSDTKHQNTDFEGQARLARQISAYCQLQHKESLEREKKLRAQIELRLTATVNATESIHVTAHSPPSSSRHRKLVPSSSTDRLQELDVLIGNWNPASADFLQSMDAILAEKQNYALTTTVGHLLQQSWLKFGRVPISLLLFVRALIRTPGYIKCCYTMEEFSSVIKTHFAAATNEKDFEILLRLYRGDAIDAAEATAANLPDEGFGSALRDILLARLKVNCLNEYSNELVKEESTNKTADVDVQPITEVPILTTADVPIPNSVRSSGLRGFISKAARGIKSSVTGKVQQGYMALANRAASVKSFLTTAQPSVNERSMMCLTMYDQLLSQEILPLFRTFFNVQIQYNKSSAKFSSYFASLKTLSDLSEDRLSSRILEHLTKYDKEMVKSKLCQVSTETIRPSKEEFLLIKFLLDNLDFTPAELDEICTIVSSHFAFSLLGLDERVVGARSIKRIRDEVLKVQQYFKERISNLDSTTIQDIEVIVKLLSSSASHIVFQDREKFTDQLRYILQENESIVSSCGDLKDEIRSKMFSVIRDASISFVQDIRVQDIAMVVVELLHEYFEALDDDFVTHQEIFLSNEGILDILRLELDTMDFSITELATIEKRLNEVELRIETLLQNNITKCSNEYLCSVQNALLKVISAPKWQESELLKEFHDANISVSLTSKLLDLVKSREIFDFDLFQEILEDIHLILIELFYETLPIPDQSHDRNILFENFNSFSQLLKMTIRITSCQKKAMVNTWYRAGTRTVMKLESEFNVTGCRALAVDIVELVIQAKFEDEVIFRNLTQTLLFLGLSSDTKLLFGQLTKLHEILTKMLNVNESVAEVNFLKAFREVLKEYDNIVLRDFAYLNALGCRLEISDINSIQKAFQMLPTLNAADAEEATLRLRRILIAKLPEFTSHQHDCNDSVMSTNNSKLDIFFRAYIDKEQGVVMESLRQLVEELCENSTRFFRIIHRLLRHFLELMQNWVISDDTDTTAHHTFLKVLEENEINLLLNHNLHLLDCWNDFIKLIQKCLLEPIFAVREKSDWAKQGSLSHAQIQEVRLLLFCDIEYAEKFFLHYSTVLTPLPGETLAQLSFLFRTFLKDFQILLEAFLDCADNNDLSGKKLERIEVINDVKNGLRLIGTRDETDLLLHCRIWYYLLQNGRIIVCSREELYSGIQQILTNAPEVKSLGPSIQKKFTRFFVRQETRLALPLFYFHTSTTKNMQAILPRLSNRHFSNLLTEEMLRSSIYCALTDEERKYVGDMQFQYYEQDLMDENPDEWLAILQHKEISRILRENWSNVMPKETKIEIKNALLACLVSFGSVGKCLELLRDVILPSLQLQPMMSSELVHFFKSAIILPYDEVIEICKCHLPTNWTTAILLKRVLRKVQEVFGPMISFNEVLETLTASVDRLVIVRLFSHFLQTTLAGMSSTRLLLLFEKLNVVLQGPLTEETLSGIEKCSSIEQWWSVYRKVFYKTTYPAFTPDEITQTVQLEELIKNEEQTNEFIKLVLGSWNEGNEPSNTVTLGTCLEMFRNGDWTFDAGILEKLKTAPSLQFDHFYDFLNSGQELKDKVLLDKFFNQNPELINGSSVHMRLQKETLLKDLRTVRGWKGRQSRIYKQPNGLKIQSYCEADIRNWAIILREKLKSKQITPREAKLEIVAVTIAGIGVHFTYDTRDTQVLAVLVCLAGVEKETGQFAQIETGEGKTDIFALFAVHLGLIGKNVDIITSGETLAEAAANKFKNFYNMFGVGMGEISSDRCRRDQDSEIVLKQEYSKFVLYGTIRCFQADYLQNTYMNKKFMGRRKPDFILVDEVDSLLLDKGSQVLYFSHKIPELRYLRPTFFEIWRRVKNHEDEEQIVNAIKADKRKFKVPKALDEFVDRRIATWVNEAIDTADMLEGEYYLSENLEKDVTVMDVDTGDAQPNSSFCFGRQQFLQIREGKRLTPESLKVIFISNWSYMRMFRKHIFGITGTLGDAIDREFLHEQYGVQFFEMPGHKIRRRIDLPVIVVDDESDALKSMKDSIFSRIHNQPALILCPTVRDGRSKIEFLKLAVAELPDERRPRIVSYLSKSDADAFRVEFGKTESNPAGQPILPNTIIVATNLGGRGTDLDVDCTDGLHVVLTYVPPNKRIRDQAFGRTSRSGKKGSTQYVIYVPGWDANCKFEDYEQEVFDETAKIGSLKMKEEIPRIEKEQELFLQFQKFLDQTFPKLGKSYSSCVLDAARHVMKNWFAFFLDEIQSDLVSSREREKTMTKFDQFMEKLKMALTRKEPETYDLCRLGSEFVLFAAALESSGEFLQAENLLRVSTEREPEFQWISRYYLCVVLLRQGKRKEGYKCLKIARTSLINHCNGLQELVACCTDIGERSDGKLIETPQYLEQIGNEIEALKPHFLTMEQLLGPPCLSKDVFLVNKYVMKDNEEAAQIFEAITTALPQKLLKPPRLSRKLVLKNGEVMNGRKKVELNPTTMSFLKEKLQETTKSNNRLLARTVSWEMLLRQANNKYWAKLILSDTLNRRTDYDVNNYNTPFVFRDQNHNPNFKTSVRSKLLELELKHDCDRLDKYWAKLKQIGMLSENPKGGTDYDVNYIKEVYDSLELNFTPNFKESLRAELLAFEPTEDSDCLTSLNSLRDAIRNDGFHVIKVLLDAEILVQVDTYKGVIVQKWAKEWGNLKPEQRKNSLGIVPEELVNDILTIAHGTGAFTYRRSQKVSEFEARYLFDELISHGLVKTEKIHWSWAEALYINETHTSNMKKAFSSIIKPKLEKIYERFHVPTLDPERANDSPQPRMTLEEYCNSIMETFIETAGNIKGFKRLKVEAGFNLIDTYVVDERKLAAELQELKEENFNRIPKIVEGKPWWNSGAFYITMLAALQMAAGVLVAVASGGTLLNISAMLISEGAGDLIFAAYAWRTGEFSWKSYGMNKALSVAISVASGGLSGVSGGSFAAVITKDLVKEMLEKTAWILAKEGFRALGSTVVGFTIEKLLDRLRGYLHDCIVNYLGKLSRNREYVAEVDSLRNTIQELYVVAYEEDQAKEILCQSYNNAFTQDVGSVYMTSLWNTISGLVEFGLRKLASWIQAKGGNTSIFTTALGALQTIISTLTLNSSWSKRFSSFGIGQIKRLNKHLQKEVDALALKRERRGITTNRTFRAEEIAIQNRSIDEFTQSVTKQLETDGLDYLQKKFLEPEFKRTADRMVNAGCEAGFRWAKQNRLAHLNHVTSSLENLPWHDDGLDKHRQMVRMKFSQGARKDHPEFYLGYNNQLDISKLLDSFGDLLEKFRNKIKIVATPLGSIAVFVVSRNAADRALRIEAEAAGVACVEEFDF